MLATALSASIVGVDGVAVRVEVDAAFGLPGLTIVGLAGARCSRPASASARPSAIPASRSQRGASRSTLRRPICRRREPATTWRWRPASSWRQGSWRRAGSHDRR